MRKRKILKPPFFNRKAQNVAQDLLGKHLVRRIEGKEISMMITETEAYDGPHDKASHASRGRTARTEVMFGPAGHFYVYLCYGMYYMLNVVTGPKDYPAAVLIRGALSNLWTSDVHRLDGPGKLTKYLKIDKKLNTLCALPKTGLWLEEKGVVVKKSHILKTSRVGVAYAGPTWSAKKYRFVFLK